jgi:hypothetical protein
MRVYLEDGPMAQSWVQLPDALPDVLMPSQGGGQYRRLGDSDGYGWVPDADIEPADHASSHDSSHDTEHIRPAAPPSSTVKPE